MHPPAFLQLAAWASCLLSVTTAFPALDPDAAADAAATADNADLTSTPPRVFKPQRVQGSENPADLLSPNKAATLFFTESNSTGGDDQLSATVSVPEFNYPVINLLTTAAIEKVVCHGNSANVLFPSKDTYDTAVQAWPTLGPFLLISYSDGCGTGASDGMHDFMLVTSVTSRSPDSTTLDLQIEYISFEQAVNQHTEITIELGDALPGATSNSTCLSDSLDVALDKGNSTVLARPVSTEDFAAISSRVRGSPIEVPATGAGFTNIEKSATDDINSLFSIKKSFVKDLVFGRYPSNAASPWGKAWRMYKSPKLTAYCVGCGAEGKLKAKATIKVVPFVGISYGRLAVTGSLSSNVNLGLVGTAKVKVPIKEMTFATFTLGDTVIPGILKFGPSLRIGAGATATLQSKGKLLAGSKMIWPNINAALDFAGPAILPVAASGLTPRYEPSFSADEVSVTLDGHLTTALGFTFGLLNNKFSRAIELIDQPGVVVTTTFSDIKKRASTDEVSATDGFDSVVDTDAAAAAKCKLTLSAKFINNVSFNLLGKTWKLASWTSKPLSKCLKKRSLEVRDRLSTVSSNSSNTLLPRDDSVESEPPDNGQTQPFEPTTNFTTIVSADRKLSLQWFTTGNVYASTGNSTDDDSFHFSGVGDLSTIINDINGRVLHGYTDELSHYKVSRLRLHAADSMPSTALAIGFTTASSKSGSSALVAFDQTGKTYYPIICAYSSCYAKVFLAQDPAAGATILQTLPALTGASGLKCSYIQLEEGPVLSS